MTEEEAIYERYIRNLVAADLELREARLAQAIHRHDSNEELADYRDDVAFSKAVLKYFGEASR